MSIENRHAAFILPVWRGLLKLFVYGNVHNLFIYVRNIICVNILCLGKYMFKVCEPNLYSTSVHPYDTCLVVRMNNTRSASC